MLVVQVGSVWWRYRCCCDSSGGVVTVQQCSRAVATEATLAGDEVRDEAEAQRWERTRLMFERMTWKQRLQGLLRRGEEKGRSGRRMIDWSSVVQVVHLVHCSGWHGGGTMEVRRFRPRVRKRGGGRA